MQVIEILIRAEDGLCREVVKHLNHIEEQILESLAWKVESPLWDKIKENENKVPTCEEVKHIRSLSVHMSILMFTGKLRKILISLLCWR